MNAKTILAIILTFSFLTACAQPTTQAAYPPPGSVSTPTTVVGYPPPTEVPTNAVYPPPTEVPSNVVPTPTHPPVDLTPAQLAAVQAVSKKYNLPVDQIHIANTEAVTWPNGCLGVVLPGVMCTDVVTQGFRIMLTANGQQFEIHTNQDGTSAIDAAQLQATLGFVVQTISRNIQIVNPNIPLGPTYNPAFNGFQPYGGSILGTAYVLDFTNVMKAIAIDANGSHDLSFIQFPTFGLAIWRGSPDTKPLLAWGTQPAGSTQTTALQISNTDGSNLQTLLSIDNGNTVPIQLVAEFWSTDGQSLYFSKEPSGIGGYILFGGASNLYKIDIKTKAITEVIPQTAMTSPQICLDAISGDYRFVADHCTQNVITVRNLQGGGTVTIQAPTDVTGFRLLGSARFSPTGDRVAFALAKGDPNSEQGWLAVGSSSGGVAKLIAVGEAGSYYIVQGWLDDQTLLVQSNNISGSAAGNQLFTIGADGSHLTKVADGNLLTIIDNR
jgi:hypothetical protein